MKRLLVAITLFTAISAQAINTQGGIQSSASKQQTHCHNNHMNYQPVAGQAGYCFKPGKMGSFETQPVSSNRIGTGGVQSAASVARSCHNHHLNYQPVHGQQGYCFKPGLKG